MSTQRNPGYEPSTIRIHRLLTQTLPDQRPLPLIPPQAPQTTVIDRVGQLLQAAATTLQLTGMSQRMSQRMSNR